jgi:hypothetical protein
MIYRVICERSPYLGAYFDKRRMIVICIIVMTAFLTWPQNLLTSVLHTLYCGLIHVELP